MSRTEELRARLTRRLGKAFWHFYPKQRAHYDSTHAAYLATKSEIRFRSWLKEEVATHKRRSRAAKKAWKTRREALH